MEKPAQIKKIILECKVVQRNFMWFEVFNPLHPEILAGGYDISETKASFSWNFDYESLPFGMKRFYADIGLKVLPHAAILTRTGFEIDSPDYLWDDLFTKEMIKPMIEVAVKQCLNAFREQCVANKVDFNGEVLIDEKTIDGLTHSIVSSYFSFRRNNDAANKVLLHASGMKITTGRNTRLCLRTTFMVIDEVLYFDPQFDRAHNLKQFIKVIPEPVYFTVKMKCLDIKTQTVALSLYHTIFFLICLDCALQLVLGDHEQELVKRLESRGMNDINRQSFIKEGAKLLDMYRQNLIKSGSSITNLEVRYDWNSLII
jgi:hypothetical protein